MKIKVLSEKDFGEVVRFLNKTMPYDKFSAASLKDQTIGDPDYDSELALVAMDGGIKGFILGICREKLGGIKLFSVKNTKNSENIAISLLEKLERKFTDRGLFKIRVGHIPPKYFQPGIDARYTNVAAILSKKGYQIEGTGQNMEVDLTSAKLDTGKEEKILRKEGIVVKRLEGKDKKGYMHFLKEWGGNWFYAGMRAYDNDPISCYIAKKKNKVVGFACHSVTADHYFGPIGVSHTMRGKGIGRVIFKRCLKDIKKTGERTATILAAGTVYFYWKSVGAEIPRLLWTMNKELKNKK